jgi:hypothetical protein
VPDQESTSKPYGHVYLITNTVNGKVYVGQTVQPIIVRWRQHCGQAKSGRKAYPLYLAMQKYGLSAFSVSVICYAQSQAELNQMELDFIKLHNSADRSHGYNLKGGGDSIGRHAMVTRAKISAARLGRTGTPWTARQRSEARERFELNGSPMRGYRHSPESRKKMSDGMKGRIPANKGKVMPEAQRILLSQIKKGRAPGNKGKKMPEHQRIAMVGRRLSEETRQRLSEAHQNQAEALRGVPRSQEVRAKIKSAKARKRAAN